MDSDFSPQFESLESLLPPPPSPSPAPVAAPAPRVSAPPKTGGAPSSIWSNPILWVGIVLGIIALAALIYMYSGSKKCSPDDPTCNR